MAITISTQPASTQVMKDHISGTLKVVATGATTYQWKQAKSASDVAGATNVASATSAELTIPTNLDKGDYYFFCTLGDGSTTVNSNIATVSVVDFPAYITGAFVNSYIKSCDTTVQTRFEKALKLSGITIPNTEKVLRTAQVELFMSVL